MQGKVIVGFTITKEGSLTNVKILKGCHPLLDAEAIRVIETTAKNGHADICPALVSRRMLPSPVRLFFNYTSLRRGSWWWPGKLRFRQRRLGPRRVELTGSGILTRIRKFRFICLLYTHFLCSVGVTSVLMGTVSAFLTVNSIFPDIQSCLIDSTFLSNICLFE
ncbi:MAG: energy transducer TonB [Candidatus Cryptobacteroides sp.]|nr:energy transducer TonB [Candidatus Cryptobacteroides sp.]